MVKPNGEASFYVKSRPPFLVKTQATLNESWIAYENEKWQAELKVTSFIQETFLGIKDSVKVFTVNILKKDGSDTTHGYDGLELKLSKQHGWLRLWELYNWDKAPNYSYIKAVELMGLELTRKGTGNITSAEVFNFGIGDVFHQRNFQSFFSDSDVTLSKKTVLEKTSTTSNVTYKMEKVWERTKNGIITFGKDTVTESYGTNHYKELPNTIIYSDVFGTAGFSRIIYDQRLNKWAKDAQTDTYNYTSTSCISEIVDGTRCPSIYYEGLGGPYGSCDQMIGTGKYGSELLYYKKGQEEWGIPLVLGTKEEAFQSQITVSPNPAKDYVNFDFGSNKEPQNVQIFDLSGKIILSQIASDKAEVNLGGFKKGIYFYTVSSNSGKGRFSGKIIVE